MVKVKVCGITTIRDAAMAVELGADAIGFIFAPSPRQVSLEKARDIVDTLPPFVQTAGVFVDEDVTTIRHIVDFCGLDMIQLHGQESPELCRKLMPRSIKAFRLRDSASLLPMQLYKGKVRALLLDTYQKEIKGGTGKVFDWNLAVKGKDLGIPVILSGGLRPANIQKALSIVRPFAVDVNSGVEALPGVKNPDLMKKMMERIRKTDIGKHTKD
jgi:phosphoribosylanthranilate isomerase